MPSHHCSRIVCGIRKASAACVTFTLRVWHKRCLYGTRAYTAPPLLPPAVLNHSTKGPGFIYLQSPHTLEAFSFLGPGVRDTRGPIHPTRATSRTVILNYLTLGEFPNLTSSDFEVAQILPDLHRAATTMDCKTDVLVLVKFRCGYLGVLTVKIVLGYDACLALGQDYTGQESFQLNIDDI